MTKLANSTTPSFDNICTSLKDGKKAFIVTVVKVCQECSTMPFVEEFVAMKLILKKFIVLVKRLLAVVCLTSPVIGFSEVSILVR